ncbi:MAG: CinA family nicotinamide mononucleotide deamidase-related protein [Verrucomicrobiales bacterium]
MELEVINTGTELLLGQVTNTHVGYFGEQLLSLGLRINRQSAVPDGEKIKEVLAGAIRRSRIILVTGGLGPTSDDLTREMTAEFLGLALIEDEALIKAIRRRLEGTGVRMRAMNHRQAMVPEGAEVLVNDNGTAPGLYLPAGIGDCRAHIFLLPGPSRELYPIFKQLVVPRLEDILAASGTSVPACRNYFFMGLGESELASRVELALSAISEQFELGYCLKGGGVIVRCICAEEDISVLDTVIKRASPEDYVAEGEFAVERCVVRGLNIAGESVATAESCTGGFIANCITNVPGSSQVFNVAYVTYADQAKRELLGVTEAMFEDFGAVSEPVAKAMAEGCLLRSGADHAISTTGIAGPDGGSEEKPVGSVWIGLASRGCGAYAWYYQFRTDRLNFKERASATAIDLLRRRLNGYL